MIKAKTWIGLEKLMQETTNPLYKDAYKRLIENHKTNMNDPAFIALMKRLADC